MNNVPGYKCRHIYLNWGIGTTFFSLFALFINLSAQPKFRFEHITSNDGLSQNSVISIFQDSRQFMWFGTFNGLNRYDGYSFKVYKSLPGDTSTISGQMFSTICEDKNGNLWIGSQDGGINIYNWKTNRFIKYKHDPSNPYSVSSDRIKIIMKDKNGTLWIGTEDGLNKYDSKTGHFIHYFSNPSDPNTLSNNVVLSLCEDQNGYIWVGTKDGLNKFNPANGKVKRYSKNSQNLRGIYIDYITCLYCDKANTVWFGTTDGLYRYDRKNDRFIGYFPEADNSKSIDDQDIKNIYEDNCGHFWIATGNGGLNLMDRADGTFTNIKHNDFDQYSLNSNIINSIYQDVSGILWIGTDGGGINKLDFRKEQFVNYYNQPEYKTSISNNKIYSIYEARSGKVWVGTFGGGINIFNPKSKEIRFKHLSHNPLNSNSLINDKVRCILEDSHGIFWIGTDDGLDRYNKKTNKFHHYTADDSSHLKGRAVFSIFESADHKIWVGTYEGGLNLYNPKTDKFYYFQPDPSNPHSISSNIVRNIFQDKSGTIWICTDDGLNRLDSKTMEFTHFENDEKNPESISSNIVLNMYQDQSGTIWVGTTLGLNKMIINSKDKNDIKFVHYTMRNGLPDNNIQGILEDSLGNLWISTNRGISKFDPSKDTFKNFTSEDGLPSNEFYANAYCKLKEGGKLLFGGDKGLTMFEPLKIKDNSHIPPVEFTDFSLFNKHVPIGRKVNGQIILKKSIAETKNIDLSYKNNIITFEFSALDYAAPKSNQYAYYMEGLEDNWNYVGNRHFATYTHLPPGNYIFKVIASNNSGIWNEKGASISITVLPPFWQTFWFRVLGIILILSIIFAIYLVKTRSIKKRSKLLKEEVEKRTSDLIVMNDQLEQEIDERKKIEEKLRSAKENAEKANKSKSDFLTNMSHELRTPLNAILGYIQILGKNTNLTDIQKGQLNTMQLSGEHLLTLISDILDIRRIEVQKEKIQSAQFNLNTLIQEVLSATKVKAVEKNLAFYYEELSSIPKMIKSDPKKLRQILLNLISNAIKFTNNGYVKLRVSSEPVNNNQDNGAGNKIMLYFEVEDTGTGIAKEKLEEIFEPFTHEELTGQTIEGTGLGLTISRKVIELMRGKIYVKSEKGKGSVFTAEIPVELSDSEEEVETKLENIITGYTGERKSILIADDNITNLEMMRAFIEPIGFTVYTALNGKKVIEKSNEIIPDIILLDLLMPVMDGYKTLEKLRSNNKLKNIKVIGISAAVAEEGIIDSFSNACDDFISKPIDVDIVLQKLKEHLGLEWVYTNEAGTLVPHKAELHEEENLVFPDATIIKNIVESAKIGNFSRLEEIINKLENSDETYRHFCNKLREFSKKFDDDGIVTFLKQHELIND